MFKQNRQNKKHPVQNTSREDTNRSRQSQQIESFNLPKDISQIQPETVLQLQRLVGNKTVISMLTSNTTTVQRYQLEGPWNKGDPVHEVLTLTAIRDALKEIKDKGKKPGQLLGNVKESKLPKRSDKDSHNLEPKKIEPSAQQFIRGVIWPDDPKGLLFDQDEGTTDYSSGFMWWLEFDPDEKNDMEALIARSHYGDLQFFHAMASMDGEDPKATKDKILKWSRFLIDVGKGKIKHTTKLKDIPLTNRLFPKHKHYTVAKLFNYEKGSAADIQQRAAGALMHLIQDSHAEGHVGRDKNTGDVTQFRSYEKQDHDKHGDKDAWGKGKNLGEHIKNTPGAANAIKRCAHVMVMIDQGSSTDDVVKYLDQVIFKLDKNVKKSGPGKDYKK